MKANPGTEQGAVGIGGSHGRCESAGLGTGSTMAATGIGATPQLGSGCETSARIGLRGSGAPTSRGTVAVRGTGDSEE